MDRIRNQERRRSRRIHIGQSLHIRPSDPKDPPFEETATTKDVSRDGVYFLTGRAGYYLGMRLFVTVPFHSAGDPMNKYYLGQVARVVELTSGQWGVGIQLLSSLASPPASPPSLHR